MQNEVDILGIGLLIEQVNAFIAKFSMPKKFTRGCVNG